MKKIRPGLLNYSIDEKWQEAGGGEFGSRADIRWVVSFEIVLFDHFSREALRKSAWQRFKSRHPEWLSNKFNRDGAIGEVFGFVVCSPAFKQNPSPDYVQTIDRVFVQNIFDEQSAIEYLKSRIDTIGEKNIESIGDDFRKFLETDEWDLDMPS